jgi:hypothetical protein
LLAHAIDSATKRKAAILREVLRRMQNVYESWDAWSGRADTKRAYVIVMTPGAAIVSMVFFVAGAWFLGLLSLGIAVLGIRVLTRRRTT